VAASADLVVNIVTKLSGDGMAQADKQTSKFKSGLSAASKVAGAALLGIGAAAIHAADAAAQDAKSQALLANAMTNGAHASKSQIQATEDWIDAQSRATGVTDDELRPALATLVRATGDVAKSQKALKTAMDISAATGKPLKSVTDAIAKGYGGNTSALSRLVPGISKAALESKNFGRILGEVQQKTKGAAREAGQTAAGQMQRFKNSLGETQEAIGAALLPALEKLTPLLVKVGQWAQDHGTLFAVIAGGVAILAAAVIGLNIAVTIYTSVTTLAASATISAWAAALGPILLVVAAVAAIVIVVILLWKKCEAFRNAVKAVWDAVSAGAQLVWASIKKIGTGAEEVFGWIKSHWRLIASILGGPVVAAALVIISHWGQIRDKIASVIGWLKDAWRTAVGVVRDLFGAIRDTAVNVFGAVRDRWQGTVQFIREIMGNIRDTAASVFSGVRDRWSETMGALRGAASGLGAVLSAPFHIAKAAIDGVIGAVQSLIGWLGRIHVPKISLPHIPGLSSAAAPAVAGAGGGAGALSAFAAPAVPLGRASSRAPVGGLTINVYGAVDPEGTARQVQRILTGHERRVGLRVS